MASIERWAAAAVVTSAMALGLPAAAQSSGNPRGNPQGSETPGTTGRAVPPPASRAPQSAAPTRGDEGRRTNPYHPEASSGHGREIGVGQPGGLGGQRAAGSRNRTTETNQAPRPGAKP
ncbi:hypothetical protein [Pseudacidovorax intermedius]|nr:hypothetical protein [Pseudacidovorax intermedius]